MTLPVYRLSQVLYALINTSNTLHIKSKIEAISSVNKYIHEINDKHETTDMKIKDLEYDMHILQLTQSQQLNQMQKIINILNNDNNDNNKNIKNTKNL